MSTIYSKQGLPEDLLTSDIENERRLKVSSASDIDTNSITAQLLSSVVSTNRDVLAQLKLLNARVEEAFNTGIEGKDCE